MSDRLIFTVKHEGHVLAYLFQRWGMGDGPQIEAAVRGQARKYHLDLKKRADAIQAVRLAGEVQYGHAIWNCMEDDDDKEFTEATREDREYLEAHRDEIIADNQDTTGITFFYGTGDGYPEYIDGWCEDAYTMNV
jgi:hypothetical protein